MMSAREMGRWGDVFWEMFFGRWGDGECGGWGDGEMFFGRCFLGDGECGGWGHGEMGSVGVWGKASN